MLYFVRRFSKWDAISFMQQLSLIIIQRRFHSEKKILDRKNISVLKKGNVHTYESVICMLVYLSVSEQRKCTAMITEWFCTYTVKLYSNTPVNWKLPLLQTFLWIWPVQWPWYHNVFDRWSKEESRIPK